MGASNRVFYAGELLEGQLINLRAETKKGHEGITIGSNPWDWYIYLHYHTLGIQSPCQMMIGVYNHLLSKVFRFHYHSQKVIGSLGIYLHYHQFDPNECCMLYSYP